ncbi:major facilitator superfamily domain-containing protein [Daedaleopsis nitida]|nr:major facilitator superfamily domain-containing protein [Daedaleopsis nitida]
MSTTETLPTTTVMIHDHIDDNMESEEIPATDLGFLPIPRHLRHDPDEQPQFGMAMNVVFALASTFFRLAEAFGATFHEVSNIPTLLQAGYATGRLVICPLGDLLRRHQLVLLFTFLAASLTIGLAVTSNLLVFEALSFLVGLCSVVPQILTPLAVDLSPPGKRAACLSIILSGLMLGVLIARILAGVVGQYVSWRVMYYTRPRSNYPAKNKGETYMGILRSMAKYAVSEPLLVQAIIINISSRACFTLNWWVTLTFLLGGPPYNFPTITIGLFGLSGMILGMVLAPFIGRTIDRFTAAVGLHLAVVVVICVGIDLFRQTQPVSLTSAVLGIDASARSRINAVFILSLLFGQVMGTAVGSKVFTQYGWRADASLNVGWTALTLLVHLARGPHVPRYTWWGWKGCYRPVRKLKQPPQAEEKDRSAVGSEANEAGVEKGDTIV